VGVGGGGPPAGPVPPPHAAHPRATVNDAATHHRRDGRNRDKRQVRRHMGVLHTAAWSARAHPNQQQGGEQGLATPLASTQ
jgi:hypothetical protein